ncbi:hypothetical protein CH253_29730 [Rhodococcus sp. 06-156-3C]|uniref:glycosyltransferase n=1 Tax=Nocardiaceae TaxID=85025 RepID=UPI0009B82270|nr:MULTISPECIES: glycosyltransferase [Rhodococcus]OZD10780.1 hypothetical protein CH280_21230 [Rhodococcus sp. 06-156-4C]OZD11558.1 hypothetical protein CH253_29730 [Rhodococcus sp. 06-156-3C]OZD13794.1 hypothetical protein CH248_27235 [Rhodococcus sp. 06-156-4a]OZD28060.1 hypothetical protein CH247_19925 [Rhodococcus sp. 06-156-3b]OZD30419.1 hypothetical protein CH284_25815 [Rhodococcus sp. 06-156-3]
MDSITIVGMEPVSVRPGGLNRYAADLVRAYEELGYSVHFVTHQKSGDGRRSILPVRLLRYFRAGIVDRNTVVDSHFALYGLSYLLGRRLSGHSYILVNHFQGPWSEESAIASGKNGYATFLKKTIEKMMYRNADKFVVLSEEFRTHLISRFRVEEGDIEVIKPGVDTARFKEKKLSLNSGEIFRICAVRRLDPRMGLDVALAAMELLGEGFELTIAGVGTDKDRLAKIVKEKSLAGRVRFAGRLSDDEVVTLYQQSHLSIVPTVALEGFGLVVLESLACGTPVVASRQGGLIDALESFCDDMLVDPGNAVELAKRIMDARDGQMPTQESCRAFAMKHSWPSVVDKHVSLAQSAIYEKTQKSGSARKGTTAVVVCSVNRPNDLDRCLRALAALHRTPDEVIVVTRHSQSATISVAESFRGEIPIRVDFSSKPGLAAAIEAGLASSTSEITCFCDDDAVPRSDWLTKIERAFAIDASVIAVGGRDNVDGDQRSVTANPVGTLSWTGKIYGNHALGKGGPRYVQHLKGANMAVWTAAAKTIPLSTMVRGEGAQYRNELILCSAISNRFTKIVYDPSIQVDHFPSTRPEGDARTPLSARELKNDVANELFATLAFRKNARAFSAVLRTVAIGTAVRPGMLRTAISMRPENFNRGVAEINAVGLGFRQALKHAAVVRRQSGASRRVGSGRIAQPTQAQLD